MRVTVPVLAFSMAAAWAMTAGSGHAQQDDGRECHLFAVTADGHSHRGALQRSQADLKAEIAAWRRKQPRDSGWQSNSVTIEAHRAEPQPYLRSRVVPQLIIKPDVMTKTSYSICWQGVISTAVCTTGAKVCK